MKTTMDHYQRRNRDPLPAFVLTLKTDDEVRSIEAFKLLEKWGIRPQPVSGVRGGEVPATEYFRRAMRTRARYQYDISPGEIGCSLGHKSIFEQICNGDSHFNLVFEDDVILPQRLPDVFRQELLSDLEVDFIHLGGLQGLRVEDALFVKPVQVAERLYSIDPSSFGYLHRTCGYIISRRAARLLLESLEEAVFRIDDYSEIAALLGSEKILFSPVVRHPVDLTESQIQAERVMGSAFTGAAGEPLSRRLGREIIKTIQFRITQAATRKRRIRGGFQPLSAYISE